MHATLRAASAALALSLAALLPAQDEQPAPPPFAFADVGDKAGLFPHVANIQGHGAAWGDADGDGHLDLYVATFTGDGSGSGPNLFFRNDGKGKFLFDKDDQKVLGIPTRGTGVVFADLDGDGDLDLYVGSMPDPKNKVVGCQLFRNDGKFRFTNVSAECGACPQQFGGRSVAVVDYDGDGLPDLLVGEDPFPGYNGSKTKATRLFRNKGGLKFDDVTKAVGLPDLPGLGVAAADVNGDGWPDLFFASGTPNVLFVNDGKGKFREVPGSRKLFAWKDAGLAGGDNMVPGVCVGDVNRDGRPDIVLGQHYSTPWREDVPNRLYLNKGNDKDGFPIFEDVTAACGLVAMGIKSPHVEIQDFDNDGWPDLYFSAVKFANGKAYPVLFRHLGLKDGLPRFRDDAWKVNDFPTAADRAIADSGKFFDKVRKDKKAIYMAPGPVGDYDGDGRLDVFLPNWWVDARSLLLRNETAGGNWLRVRVKGGKGVNARGVGSVVRVYEEGKLGQASALLGQREIAVGYGYASGQPAYAHFGLGKAKTADVEVTLPHGKGKLTRKGVAAGRELTVER